MNQRMKYSEQMKRYRLSIVAYVRFELKVEAKNEEESRRKVAEQACSIAGTDSFLGYFAGPDSEFVYGPYEIRWESSHDNTKIESLREITHEYCNASSYLEHVKQYQITGVEQYRCELEVQARTKEEAEAVFADWALHPSSTESLLGYGERYDEFLHVQYDIRWEFIENSRRRKEQLELKSHCSEIAFARTTS